MNFHILFKTHFSALCLPDDLRFYILHCGLPELIFFFWELKGPCPDLSVDVHACDLPLQMSDYSNIYDRDFGVPARTLVYPFLL